MPGVHAIDLPGMLRRRWHLLGIGAGVGIALSLVYYMCAELKYESTAQVLVMKKDAKLPTKGVEGNDETDTRVSEDLLATHMQIIGSQEVIKRALADHGLDELDSILEKLDDDETPADYVIDNLVVTRGGSGQAKTAHVLNLAFRHTSDEECKLIVDAIVDSYRKFLGNTFENVSAKAVELIAEAKDEVGRDLEHVEEEYQKFREDAPLLWRGDESSNVHAANFEQLETTLADLKTEYAEAESRLDVVKFGLEELKRTGAPEMQQLALLDEKHITRLELLVNVDRGAADTEEFQALQPARLEGARAEFDALLTLLLKEKTLLMDLGDQHPSVVETRDHIKMAREFLQKKEDLVGLDDKIKLTPTTVVDAYLALLNFDLLAIKKRQQQIEKLAQEEREEAKQMVKHELGAERLRKEVERKQDLFDAVLDRLREINLVKEYGGFITEPIEQARLGEKVWPKGSWCLLIGMMLGLVAGAGTATALELIDNSFRNPSEVRDALGLPVLTHIPQLGNLEAQQAAAATGAPTFDPALVVYRQPRSRQAEAFRALRTTLFFSSPDSTRQVLACTSANPGDGKTTMATSLAISIAQSGRKVLIMDCDLRRPRVHRIFNVDPAVGVSNVLSGEHEALEAIQPTEVNNLSVMPCGPIVENPSELLTATVFKQLLDHLRDHFDYVVIDTPPVLAVADPCIVAQLADSVILTVRTSQDSRAQTIEAKDLLARVDARIIGVVVNIANEQRKSFGYGYNLKYGYGGYTYGDGYTNERSKAYYEHEVDPKVDGAGASEQKPNDPKPSVQA
jgi:capsular exopolysaccharide synthesis family protein